MQKRSARQSPKSSRAGVDAISIILGVTTLLTLVAVDVRAAAAFDAPKRLVAMLGIAAAVVATAFTRIERVQISRRDRALMLAGAAAVLIVASALVSPRRAIALDTLRMIAVFAAVTVLCALVRRAWKAVAYGFVAGAAVNAVFSILQWTKVHQPFRYVATGGRGDTSAFTGNTGVLGLILALAMLLIVPPLLRGRRSVIALLLLLATALVISRTLTAVVALTAGIAVIAFRLATRRQVVMLAIAGVVVSSAIVIAIAAARGGGPDLNRVLTYRLGPWAAGVEMFLARPVAGWGPGTYSAEFAPHLTAAERRWQTSLVNPGLVGSYAEAHNDYIQALAELGAPAALLLIAAAALAMAGLTSDAESTLLLSVLVAGAVAALTWFPLQRPATALLLLAALGRAWRISHEARSAS